ncbi:MAG: molybdopterin-dependent oxidoreductase, partial [Chloroflexi bacterium]|nr:molybdopterin-dependent oxidoreductase [Chloroflexota bacterium]
TLGAFALGMAYVIVHSGLYDQEFVSQYTFGFDDFTDDAGVTHHGLKSLLEQEYTLDRVEAITGVPAGTIARLAGEFAASPPAIAMPPTEGAALANGNALGTAMAVHALNALVASIDAPGGVIVQRYPNLVDWPRLTLDPTAVTGCAHERVDGAGTNEFPITDSAYAALPDRVLSQQPYALNAVLLCGANPVFDTAAGSRFAQALDSVPFVVNHAPVLDESAALADLILPTCTSLEAWSSAYVEGTGYPGLAVTPPAVKPVYDARSAEDVLLGLGQQIGGSVAAALPWRDLQTLLRFRVTGSSIDWDALVKKGAWSQMIYTNAEPGSPVWSTQVVGADRVNAPHDGRFDFFSREMFYAIENAGASPADRDCLPHFDAPVSIGNSADYPFILSLSQTMTQPSGWSAIVPTLQEVYGLQDGVRWDSWVELSRQAAVALGIADGDWVWVESPRGKIKTRARLVEGLWPNAAAMPLGQGHRSSEQWGRDSVQDAVIGANPLALCENAIDKWSALPLATARVKVYKA